VTESSIQKRYGVRSRELKRAVELQLSRFSASMEPKIVYEPISYILSSGGKRIRSLLVLLSCKAVGGKMEKALPAAAAFELLHNFTLIHDDVMDNADKRRGRLTIHKKWDQDIAILAGDEMIAQAYHMILKTKTPRLKQVLDIFTDAMIQVCEGQGLDKDFETRKKVSIKDYLGMIDKKTGKIISASCEIGALIGEGTKQQILSLKKYGEFIGRAFQIRDDLLDITGSEKEFGKKIGGDIIEGKKTYLLLTAIEAAHKRDRVLLNRVINHKIRGGTLVNRIRDVYDRLAVLDKAREEIHKNTNKAEQLISILRPSFAKNTLFWLSNKLVERTG
jgi:geranylgeranyl diphosphate synthase, type II